MAIYLLVLSIIFALAIKEEHGVSPSAFMLGCIPFIFVIDYVMRFFTQQTPSHLIKPYLLLPIPKYTCIDAFIFKSLFNLENFAWMIFLLPYAIMTIIGREGFLTALLFLIAWQIVLFIISQIYLINRCYLKDNIGWIILPIILLGILLLPGLVTWSFDGFWDFYYAFGEGLMEGNLIFWLILICLFVSSLYINRIVQCKHVMAETNRQTSKTTHIHKYTFFERWGEIGEFMKLELKLITRNKQPRNSTITIWCVCVGMWFIYSMAPSLIDSQAMYDGYTGRFFWCLYCTAFPGIITLQRLMAYEGNYIDALMIHHENLLKLFRAKYYFYSIVLILPAILGIISSIWGNWSIWQVVACLLYTMGPIYCMAFHMALINKDTIPLTASITHHTGADFKFWPSIISMATVGLPILIIFIFSLVFKGDIGAIALSIISLPFVIWHNKWLRSIYKKLMKIKYENMESLRASR